MKGSSVLLSSLLSIVASQAPGVTAWCYGFQQGTDASGGCNNGKDIIYPAHELDNAKSYCEGNGDCLGVTKHPNGLFTPRCGNMYTEADNVPDILSWLNKDGCLPGKTWCDGFQQKKDASGGCDNGEEKVFSAEQLEKAKDYCDQIEECLGVTGHPNGKFTPRCGKMFTEADNVPDTVSWLNKDGCV